MEDAVTVGVPQSVVLASLAVLKFVDRRLSAIVAVMVIAGTVACSEYLIAIPVMEIMGLSALAWLYELLVKLAWASPLSTRATSRAQKRASRIWRPHGMRRTQL